MIHYKPTPLFRADVRKIAHGLIIRTIRYVFVCVWTLQISFCGCASVYDLSLSIILWGIDQYWVQCCIILLLWCVSNELVYWVVVLTFCVGVFYILYPCNSRAPIISTTSIAFMLIDDCTIRDTFSPTVLLIDTNVMSAGGKFLNNHYENGWFLTEGSNISFINCTCICQ